MATHQLARPEFDQLNEQVRRLRAYVWRCSAESLAELTGLDAKTIYRFRAGKPVTVNTLRRIALSRDFDATYGSESQVETRFPSLN